MRGELSWKQVYNSRRRYWARRYWRILSLVSYRRLRPNYPSCCWAPLSKACLELRCCWLLCITGLGFLSGISGNRFPIRSKCCTWRGHEPWRIREKQKAQRRKKARDEGQIARTRELSTALAWGGAIAVLAWQVPESVRQWRGLLQSSLDISIAEPLSAGGPVMFWNAVAILRWSVPVLVTSWVFAVAGGLLQGGFTFASEALTPNIEKLSPAGKFGQMFSLAGLSGILKSLIPFSVILWIGISTIQNHWQMVVKSADLSVGAFVVFLTSALWGLCWKSGLVLVAWAGADYLFVWWKLEGDLKMSHQEV